MLTAYFDESSTDGEYQYAVVAGFVGNTKTWMEFERLWKRAESRDAKKSRAKKSNRKNVVLAQIASGLTLLPIYVVLDKKTWDAVLRVNKKLEHAWNMPNPYSTAYGVCCYWCCALLDAWAKKFKRLPRSQRIKVVFDDGNSQKLSFDRGYRDYRAEKTNSRLASVPLYDTDDECIPLRLLTYMHLQWAGM